MSLALSAVLETRASYSTSVNKPIDPGDGQQGTEHTSKTLPGQKTSREREHVHVERRWAPLHSNVVENRSETHSDGEERLGNGETLRYMVNDQLPAPNERSM